MPILGKSIVDGRSTTVFKKGYTLIELITVIIILAILTTFGTYTFEAAQQRSRDSKRKENLKDIKTALVSYYTDHQQYPPPCNPSPCAQSAQYTSASGQTDWIPNLADYIQKLPKDPKQAGINILSTFANLFKKIQPQVAAASIVTISADFDGDVNSLGNCIDTNTIVRVEGGWRTYIRFPLTQIPQGAIITNAVFTYRVITAGTTRSALQAYNQDGQANPQLDTICQTRRSRTANDPTPYFSNYSLIETTGIKNLTLPASALTDIQAANNNSSIDRFSLALNEFDISYSSQSWLEATNFNGSNPPKLTITYTSSPTPPPTTTPLPTTTPTPPSSPPPAPANCQNSAYVYCYIVAADRQTFVLWTQLENNKDNQIIGKPDSPCIVSPSPVPPSASLNYCLANPN